MVSVDSIPKNGVNLTHTLFRRYTTTYSTLCACVCSLYLVQRELTLCKCTASKLMLLKQLHELKIMDIYLENENVKSL